MIESPKSNSWLSPAQSKLLAFTLCSASLIALLLLAGFVLRSLSSFIDRFSTVLWPLAVAAILAILLRPLVRLVEDRVGFNRNASILLLYLLVVCIGGMILWGVGGEVIRQSRELIGLSQEWPERIEARIKESIQPQTWSAFALEFEEFKHSWKETLAALGSKTPEITKGSAKVLQNTWSGIGTFFPILHLWLWCRFIFLFCFIPQ